MDSNFLSVEQVLAAYPFSNGTLRRLLFNRKTNGLQSAILQKNRLIIFNKNRFEQWIEEYFSSDADVGKLSRSDSRAPSHLATNHQDTGDINKRSR